MFLVSEGLCSGLLRNSSLVLPLLSVTGLSVYLPASNTKSCEEEEDDDDDDDDERRERQMTLNHGSCL